MPLLKSVSINAFFVISSLVSLLVKNIEIKFVLNFSVFIVCSIIPSFIFVFL